MIFSFQRVLSSLLFSLVIMVLLISLYVSFNIIPTSAGVYITIAILFFLIVVVTAFYNPEGERQELEEKKND